MRQSPVILDLRLEISRTGQGRHCVRQTQFSKCFLPHENEKPLYLNPPGS